MINTTQTADIVLIRGGSILSKGRVGSLTATLPLGLAYLAGYLRKHNYSVHLIDALSEDPMRLSSCEWGEIAGLSNEEVLNKITWNPKIIGFSCMFSNDWIYLKKLISKTKKKFPNVITVMGGEHASALAEYVLNYCEELDFVIRGEGEHSLLEFAEYHLKNSGEINEIPGLVYRKGNEVIANDYVRIKNISEIPNPAWDLLPVNNFLKYGIANNPRKGIRCMPILATRGCPYTCKFCSNPQMYGKSYKLREVDDVIQEISSYKMKYNINSFELHDLTFVTNRKWVLEFTSRLIKEDMNLHWDIPTTRSEAINKQVVRGLVNSGCSNICITPDSGSARVLKEIEKRVDLKKVNECIQEILSQKTINLRVNIVIGFPNERHLDIIKSILYGIRLGIMGVPSVLFYRFTPYPGSVYFDLVKERNMIPEYGDSFDEFLIDNVYNEIFNMVSYSKHVSSLWITIYMFSGYLFSSLAHFIVQPKYIYTFITRIANRDTKTNLEVLVMNLLIKLKMIK